MEWVRVDTWTYIGIYGMRGNVRSEGYGSWLSETLQDYCGGVPDILPGPAESGLSEEDGCFSSSSVMSGMRRWTDRR